MLICEVRVYSSDPLVFTFQKRSTGRDLWNEVLQVVPLAEPRFFGLLYSDDYNRKLWLDKDKALGKQVKGSTRNDSVLFYLKVKMWPSDPFSVTDDIVRCLLVVQLQEDLLDGSISSSQQTLLQIAVYLIQSLGDYDETLHKRGYSSQYCLVPNQGRIEAKIEALHATERYRGLKPSDCDCRILGLARRSDSYGAHFFNSLDTRGCRVRLGICCEGILVLSSDSVIVNKFTWDATASTSYKGKRFFVKIRGLISKMEFTIEDKMPAKEIWRLFTDFYAFYYLSKEQTPVERTSQARRRFFSVPVARKVSSPEGQESSSSVCKTRLPVPPSNMWQMKFNPSCVRRRCVSEWRTLDSSVAWTKISSSKSLPSLGGSDLEAVDDEGFDDGCGELLSSDVDVPDVDIVQVVRKLSEQAAENDEPTIAYFCVIREIRDTERSYVRDLDILNGKFRSAVERSRLLLPKQVSELFLNLDIIQEFHKSFLCELEERLSLWEGNLEKYVKCEIGDIMKRRMACMKLYTNYVTNEAKIFEMLTQLQSKSSDFAKMCAQFELSNVCHRPVSEFFYRPFQRMVHYKELLKRLHQNANPSHINVSQIKEAAEHIEIALTHVNTSTRAAENARKMTRIQRELIGVDDLLRPGRVFIMEGNLLKLGVNGAKVKIFFLFNDILLYAAKRTVIYGSQLVAKKAIPLSELKVEDEVGKENGSVFKLTDKDGSFIVMASSRAEKQLWLEAFRKAMKAYDYEAEGQGDSFHDLRSSLEAKKLRTVVPSLSGFDQTGEDEIQNDVTAKSTMTKKCMNCLSRFGIWTRKNCCKGCGRVVCGRCLTHCLSFSQKLVRVCDECYSKEQRKLAGQRRGSAYWRQTAMCRTPSAESTLSDSAEENRAISPISSSGDKAKFPVPATATAIASRLGDDRLSTMRERSRALVAFQANSLDLPARGKVLLSLQDKQFSSDRELSGYLITKMKGKAGWKRFWLTVANSCFNFYRSHEDPHLIQALPLPEFDLSLPERNDSAELDVAQQLPYIFKLYSNDQTYYFMTESLYSLERWIEVLNSVVRLSHGRCGAKMKKHKAQRSHTIV